MSKKIVFALSLFVLLCLSLYVRFNSLQAKCSNGYAVAPLFTLTDIEGNIVALENLTGKIVVLDFFYPQCQYSDDQIVHLEEIYEKYTRDELEIISISPKEIPIQDLEEFKTGPNRFSDLEYEISWIIERDIETQNVTAKYNILGYPTTLIIDQDGYIRYRHVGLTEESVLRPEIESLLLKTIYVDDDNVSGPWNGTKEHPYQNITSGLKHTSDNDIVFVQNGTYYEHVVVNKSLSIIGEDKEETIIGGNGTGVVASVTRSNVAISGFTIQNGSEGIKLHSLEIGACNNITIYGNSITDMIGSCISVLNSYNNSIVGNTISNSSIGINLGPSYSNIIRQNVISNNRGKGIASGLIMITPSLGSYSETDSANKMFENLIIDNQCGVNITNRSGEIIFHNVFVNNTVQAFVLRQYGINATNTWNNRVEGNYWSDYNESDSNYDGIWDTLYVIDELNKDNYPLMGIFHSFNTSLSYYVNVISNSTIEDFRYFESNSTIKIHVSNMTENQTYGFCRICIPKDLITPDYYVEINDGAIEVLHFNNTLYDNDTHRWIYFAYEHSILEIVIVPEFPSFLVLPLFMIATLLAVTVYKRKHQTRNKKREV